MSLSFCERKTTEAVAGYCIFGQQTFGECQVQHTEPPSDSKSIQIYTALALTVEEQSSATWYRETRMKQAQQHTRVAPNIYIHQSTELNFSDSLNRCTLAETDQPCFPSSFCRWHPFILSFHFQTTLHVRGDPRHCLRRRPLSKILIDPRQSTKLAKFVLPWRSRQLSLLYCQRCRTGPDKQTPQDAWWISSLEIHFGQAMYLNMLKFMLFFCL